MGILRRLPEGLGAEEEAMDLLRPAIRELPGTVAASRPPEAARNCLRSIEELMAEESWGSKSLGRDLMRFTSANARQVDTAVPGALYDVMERKQASKIDFLEAFFLRRGERPPSENANGQRRLSSLSGGTETGTVRARSGGCLPRWKASTNISMAWPALGGTKIVAASSPLLTQAWPVLGRPSHPRNGKLSQRSFSFSSGSSSKALRAPMAMESSWAAMRSMAALREVVSFNQERTAFCELCSVHCARRRVG